MKRRSFLGLAAALALAACGKGEPRLNHPDLQAATIVPTANLFDGQGRPRNFEEFRGKAVIVFFGYTSCPDVCPTTLARFAEVMKQLGPDAERVQVILVSVDPEIDTPERLTPYVTAFHPSFIGLAGDMPATEAVAREFKVFFAKAKGGHHAGMIDHTTGAYVFDPAGRIRLYVKDDAAVENIAGDLRRLLAEKST